MARTITQMEAVVAATLSEYLALGGAEVEDAGERKARLCSAISALMEQLLDGDDRWPTSCWVDDIDMCAVERDGPTSVRLSGLACIGDDRRGQGIEPVTAMAALAPTGGELAGYEVFVGDAAIDLGTVPFGQRRPKAWPDVSDWIFTLRRPD